MSLRDRWVKMQGEWFCDWCGYPGDDGDKALMLGYDDGIVFCSIRCADYQEQRDKEEENNGKRDFGGRG